MIKKDYTKKKKRRSRFLEVDVWRSEFGTLSEKAIFEVYARKFNVDFKDIHKLKFSHCVNELRKLEDPTYVPSKDKSK